LICFFNLSIFSAEVLGTLGDMIIQRLRCFVVIIMQNTSLEKAPHVACPTDSSPRETGFLPDEGEKPIPIRRRLYININRDSKKMVVKLTDFQIFILWPFWLHLLLPLTNRGYCEKE
jgi:hypothetical protein